MSAMLLLLAAAWFQLSRMSSGEARSVSRNASQPSSDRYGQMAKAAMTPVRERLSSDDWAKKCERRPSKICNSGSVGRSRCFGMTLLLCCANGEEDVGVGVVGKE